MNSFQHPLCNHVFRAPANWDHTESPCDDLHVVIVEEPNLTGFVSFWQPSADELALLAAGKPVSLTVYGASHPVVAVGVLVESTEHLQ